MAHYKKNMKNTAFTISILFMTIFANCQNWAPTGAKWTYTETFYMTSSQDTLTIRSIGDTVIQSHQCKVLKRSGGTCDLRPMYEYMYSDSGKVYFYDSYRDSFQLLYNFNASAGYTYKIFPNTYLDNDSIILTVDSVSTININGFLLKKLFLHKLNSGGWWPYIGGVIIENIGDLSNMFPWIYGACDANWGGPLRCYSDSIIGAYDFGTAPSCDYVFIGINENKYSNDVSIYPNPATDKIEIECLDNNEINISIYNLIGKLVLQKEFDNNKTDIDIGSFETGMYIIKVTGANWTTQRKIIKK